MLHGRNHSVLEWLPSQKKLEREAVQKPQCNVGSAEMWIDVRDYEGRYQVSTLGRVKSLARNRRGKSGSVVPMPERIMILRVMQDNGRQRPYISVHLRNGGPRDVRGKQKLVHRLVADAFIKPLEHGDQVDHINGIHGDNRVENLRVMKIVEHARLHPVVANPLPHDLKTGQFLPRGH
jgi:hypothetical protein